MGWIQSSIVRVHAEMTQSNHHMRVSLINLLKVGWKVQNMSYEVLKLNAHNMKISGKLP